MTHYASNSPQRASDWLFGTVKRNPEGLLLLAAGCALLMRSGSRPSKQPIDRNAKQWRPSATHSQHTSSVSETVAEAGRSAGEYVSGVAEKVGDMAGSYASAVSDYAEDAIGTVSEQSRDFARQAQSSFERTTDYMLERQPLAVAIIGLATGAAAAAAFSPTEMETRALGPAGERLREAAGEVTERLKEAGAKAGERLMDVAEERGLTREGLKDAARDVGATFSNAMEGTSASDARSKDVQSGDDVASSQGRTPRTRESKMTSPRQPGEASKGSR
jgi:hypothetical protein